MGWAAKAGAWIWAHKKEIATAWSVFKALRDRRVAKQRNGESAVDYYKREGFDAAVDATGVAAEGAAAIRLEALAK